jgi:hypothetical protein
MPIAATKAMNEEGFWWRIGMRPPIRKNSTECRHGIEIALICWRRPELSKDLYQEKKWNRVLRGNQNHLLFLLVQKEKKQNKSTADFDLVISFR